MLDIGIPVQKFLYVFGNRHVMLGQSVCRDGRSQRRTDGDAGDRWPHKFGGICVCVPPEESQASKACRADAERPFIHAAVDKTDREDFFCIPDTSSH